MARAPEAWDCLVVGAGPAGLSAAVYMGRFRRRTVVVDDESGRWAYGQRNENYLGFPNGVSALRLHRLGREQAERFGVAFRKGTVVRVRPREKGFLAETTRAPVEARTVIWAAGVQDQWPSFPEARRLVGERLFSCIVCDGWRTLDGDVLLIGDDDKAAGTTLQFRTYTRRLTLLVDPASARLSPRARQRLIDAGIRILRGTVRHARTEDGAVGVRLSDGSALRADYLFSLRGPRPRTQPLAELAVELARNGHVRIDDRNRTSLPGLLAAGDVTDKHSHQVASAVHEGAQAAQAANALLYPPLQRLAP
jgi:thioredoxin reductase (NADPH)